jgi:spore maturation protein CgeB
VTLVKLADGSCDYVSPELIRAYHLYLSFTGGPTLRYVETHYGSPLARPLYCSVDPERYRPCKRAYQWGLGYLGTYSDDRQPALDELLLQPAREWKQGRFTVVGPMYPESIVWPGNVARTIHLSPREHPAFYGSQRFTLNITRTAMKQAGYSPSVRLFEAGACAAPIISDWWDGLDTILTPGREVLIASKSDDTLRLLKDLPDDQRRAIGDAARQRMLAEHTPVQRAIQLEAHWKEAHDNLSADSPRGNRRRGQGDGRMAAGMASQRPGQGTGGTAGGASGQNPNSGRLHEPAGAGH